MSVFMKQLAALSIVWVVISKECLMCARLIYLADVSEDSGLTFGPSQILQAIVVPSCAVIIMP